MTAIDSGAYTAAVTDYVRPRERSGVMATKGSSEYGKQLLTRPQKRTTKYRTLVWMVGTIAVKDVIFGRLRKVTMPGPGYQHFSDQIDLAFLKQYGAERRRPHRVNGQQVWLYEQIGSQRNEAIDLTGLSLVALYALGDPVRRSLSRRPEAAPAPAVVTPEAQILAATEVLPVKQVRRPAFRKPGWVDSWR
jgi:phage terminase large subunit GpA-like protein